VPILQGLAAKFGTV